MSVRDENAEREYRKQLIFDRMSPRRQKQVLKRGWDKWDPFLEPKNPIDIRKDPTNRTTQSLVRLFLQSRDMETISTSYNAGALEIALGLINGDDRCRGMFEFSVWYQRLLDAESKTLP